MKAVGSEQCGAHLVPGTKVCNLLAQESIWKGVYLSTRSPREIRTAARGCCCQQAQPPHMLGHLGPSAFSQERRGTSLLQHCLCRDPANADWCCPQQPACPGGVAVAGSGGTGVLLWLQPPAQAA